MRDGFAAVGAVVDHEAKAAGEVEFLGENAGGEKEVAEERLVGGGGFTHAGNEFFWNDQKMDRSLRLDVMQDDAEVVLVLDLGGNFAVDDALEDGFWHGENLQEITGKTESFGYRDSRRLNEAGNPVGERGLVKVVKKSGRYDEMPHTTKMSFR